MANINTTAIITAVRDVVNSAAGSLRTISATRFDGGVYEGMSDEALSLRAVVRPVFDIRVTGLTPHPASPPRNSSLAIYTIVLEVVVTRHINAEHKLIDASRDSAAGLAATDGDVIAQALEWPGNLAQDSGGNATGLIGQNLEYRGSDLRRFQLADNRPGLIETAHRFSGFVKVTQATS